LAGTLPRVGALYSSPLTRAVDTAGSIAARQRLQVSYDDRLKEISFGAWEGLTRSEIRDQFPESAAFFDGHDVIRGGTGETFDQVRLRVRSALRDIATRHPGEKVAVVSHGGAIRAWMTELLGFSYARRNRLSILANTGYARVASGVGGQTLVAWNLAPHLDTV
jgi:broad specificity phosphatase PhoE